MSYTVTSGFEDLDGTCEITGDAITSYTSNTLGAATIEKLTGTGLHAKLTFIVGEGKNREESKYHVHATASGGNFSGHAKDKDDFSDTEEPWAATATGVEPVVAAKGV